MCENHRNIPVREMEPPPLSAPLVSSQRIVGSTETVASPTRVVADNRGKVAKVVDRPSAPARQEVRTPEKPVQARPAPKAQVQAPKTEPKAVAQPVTSATEQKPAVIEDDGDRLARELRQIAEQNRRKGGGHHRRRR